MIKKSLNLGFGKNLSREEISKIVNGGAKVISENTKNDTISNADKIGPYSRDLDEMELDEYAIFPNGFLRCLWMKHPKTVATLLVASILLFDAAAFSKDKPPVTQTSQNKNSSQQSNCNLPVIDVSNLSYDQQHNYTLDVLGISSRIHIFDFDIAKHLNDIKYFHYFKKDPPAFAFFTSRHIWAGVIISEKKLDNNGQKPNGPYIKKLTYYDAGKCGGPKKEEDGQIDKIYIIDQNRIVATTTAGRVYEIKYGPNPDPKGDAKEIVSCSTLEPPLTPDQVLCLKENGKIVYKTKKHE